MKPGIHYICATLKDHTDDDGSVAASLAEWMARPLQDEEIIMFAKEGQPVDWPGALAWRVRLLKTCLDSFGLTAHDAERFYNRAETVPQS